MQLSLSDAARAVNKDKTTLFRQIKSGKLSATREGNVYKIDMAELNRVYKNVSVEFIAPKSLSFNEPQQQIQRDDNHDELISLRTRCEMLTRDNDNLNKRIDQLFDQHQRLTNLLTHQKQSDDISPITTHQVKKTSFAKSIVIAIVAAIATLLIIAGAAYMLQVADGFLRLSR